MKHWSFISLYLILAALLLITVGELRGINEKLDRMEKRMIEHDALTRDYTDALIRVMNNYHLLMHGIKRGAR
jgi:hypothetical protein